MCGIAGFFGVGSREDIKRMSDALVHRGPDAGGIFMDGQTALGHRRLSIVDIAGGSQPMRGENLIIVYNGEVYNHLDIRRGLEKEGHIFHSAHSDTETVLHAFAQWGPACLGRFNGMFAFAVYSPAQKKIWLARDRFGEKPLFYAHNEKGFAFASEICSLKLWPGFSKRLREDNIQRFFAWNYLPAARTIHEDCKSLPPGSWLVFDTQTGRCEVSSYWSFALEPDESLTDKMEPELAEELRRLLTQSVKRRLLSDVPLGIFLSGGIDSSAVLGAAAHVVDPGSIDSYTIGFREKSFDESPKAKAVAAHFNVRNSVEYLTEMDMRNSIAGILSRMSEPFGDASLIPTYHLCRFAREHVKVALSGDGGDELFGGYDPMAAITPASLYRRLVPGFLHDFSRKILSFIPASDRNMSLEFKLKRMLRGLSYTEDMQLPVWMSGLEPAEVEKFFKNPLSAAELYADAARLYKSHPNANGLEQALLFFTCLYLSDDILVKSDRASMMVSLETRAVFLDNDLVDFCRRLPMRFKYRNGKRKYLLKKALAGWLPKEILEQPKKGFGIPLNLWLRSLPEPRGAIPGLKPDVMDYCYSLHKKRAGDFRFFLWDLQAYSQLSN